MEPLYVWYILLGVNAFSFLLYVTDKCLAKLECRRISERHLLIAATLCGAVGAAFAMVMVRHKTRKTRFRIIVPLMVVVQLAALAYLLYITY